MGFSVDVLNSIRDNASTEYAERIPQATRDNIAAIGNALQTYTPLYNEFCDALINKIGKTIIESKLFKNKLARFKSGSILSQQDVEEIFIDMAKSGYEYDPQGTNALARTEDDNVKVVYHRMNRRNTYDITLGDLDFLRNFRSEATLDSFITQKLNSVYSRAAHDEWLIMKNLLATYKNKDGKCGYFDYQVVEITSGNAETAAKTFVKTLRKAITDVGFASTDYNTQGVTTWSDPSDLVLLVNKDVVAEVDVEVLAKAFNLGKTDIEVPIVVMDDFGKLENTYGLLIDKDFLKVFDTLSTMEPQRNAKGMFTIYYHQIQQILSCSPFKTAVRFTTEEPEGGDNSEIA